MIGTEAQEVRSFTQMFSQLKENLGFYHCSTITFCILSQSRKIFQVFEDFLQEIILKAPVSKK